MRNRAFVFIAAAVASLSAAELATGQAALATPARSGYAPVNGLQLYYEIRGAGKPLVLLHGGLGSIEMFGPVLAALATGRQVIAVDLQGHGRTADIDRPLAYESMGDDVAALVKYLGLGKVDVMGYSLGAGVALQAAIRHPEVVRKLVVASFAFKRDGWYPEVLAGEAQMGAAAAEQMKQTPMYKDYSALAPRPQDWPVLLTKLGDLLKRDYDWTGEVKALKTPTLLVFGDGDAIPAAHSAAFFALFGGGLIAPSWDGSGRPNAQLAILPGVTHYDIFMSPALSSVVVPFLDSAK